MLNSSKVSRVDKKGRSPSLDNSFVRRGVIVLGLSLLGCGAVPQARFARADAVLERLKEQTDCSRAVVGEAQLVLSSGLFEMSGDMLYMAAAPDRLRLDLYSAFGVTLSTLTSDGERFALYNLQDKSFSYGPAKTCNIERFTRVPIPPLALVELLRGRPPLLAHQSSDIEIRLIRPWFSAAYYRIDLQGDNESTQRLQVGIFEEDLQKSTSSQRLFLRSVEVRQGGRLSYKVRLEGYRAAEREVVEPSVEEIEMGIGTRSPSGPECSAAVPGQITFTVPGSGYRLAIHNEQVSHNPPLLPTAFTQPPPSGVVSRHVDCQD